MTTAKFFAILTLCAITSTVFAQQMPADMIAAIKTDDSAKLATLITKDNVNSCWLEGEWQYSTLAQTIRANAMRCFNLLISLGADVNKSCAGYVPPLMHAAKYGHLDMVKILVAKGADINYKYSGDYTPAVGQTPLTYAEKFNQTAVADYLRSLKPKP
jgi:ankyrin repeat protein